MIEPIIHQHAFKKPRLKPWAVKKNAIIIFSKLISHILHQPANAYHQQLLWLTHRIGYCMDYQHVLLPNIEIKNGMK